jgi:hypothetical protein
MPMDWPAPSAEAAVVTDLPVHIPVRINRHQHEQFITCAMLPVPFGSGGAFAIARAPFCALCTPR